MFKLFAAALVAAPLAVAASAPASAKVDLNIYLGVPHYNYNVGPGYKFRPGHGWYNPRQNRLTCAQGERYLERRGFNVVQRRDCSAPVYQCRVKNRNGRNILINLNARTGNYNRV